eukprot:3547026-Pyramimonas_sp.AAC.1
MSRPLVARARGARATISSMRSEGARAATSKCREPCESTRKCRLFSAQPGRCPNPMLTHNATPEHPFDSAADVITRYGSTSRHVLYLSRVSSVPTNRYWQRAN